MKVGKKFSKGNVLVIDQSSQVTYPCTWVGAEKHIETHSKTRPNEVVIVDC